MSIFIQLLETITEDLKRRFTLPNMEAYNLSLFISTTFLNKNIYCTQDYKYRVSNVSKRFSTVDSNK